MVNVTGQGTTASLELQLTRQPGGDSQSPPITKQQALVWLSITDTLCTVGSPQALPGLGEYKEDAEGRQKGTGRQLYQPRDMFPD